MPRRGGDLTGDRMREPRYTSAMRDSRTVFLLLLLALLPWCVGAADGSDLYVAEGVVTDEGSETRNRALTELLGEVLVRVSGNAMIAGQPAARELLDAAPSLVQQYRYRTTDSDAAVVRTLWARFDQPVVERMMRERNLPVWTQRPRALWWIATERGGQRALLNLDNEPQARSALLAQAQRRGMPLQLPLMDIEDQTQLTPADLWSDYQPAIRQASARYPHDVIVVGRLRAEPDGGWRGVWSIVDVRGSQGFDAPAKGLPAALAFALDQTQNLLAARYAPMPGTGAPGGTLARFSGVYDLAAYGRLVGLLEQLEPVAQLALRHVNGDSFTFEFQLRGDQHDLARALQNSGRLVPEPAPLQPFNPTSGGTGGTPVAVEPEADLYYRLAD